MAKLTETTLGGLDQRVAVPTYARGGLSPGIVHIGVGGFHRAHQAVYLDDLLQRGAREWSICGVGLLPHDRLMRDALVPQDCLYTVVERSAAGNQARVVGSMARFLLAPDDPQAVLNALAAPETRVVTLTITEGGYNYNQATGEFNAHHADILRDLAHQHEPVTVFGYLAEAMDRRRRSGGAPFTVLSCDNLTHNGDTARLAVLSFAALRDSALVPWIERNVSFPNSMVDRITPQTTDADRALVRDEFGIADAWPVVCEPFRQWIIEDVFCNGRPPLEDVGAQFTSDVHPYEMMKIFLLNASHSAMGYLGALAGYPYIADVMADPLFRTYIAALMDTEVTPLLAPVPGIDLTAYKRTLIERFANPTIRDQVSRICLDGSAKVPRFVLPSLREQLARGGPTRLLTLAVAGWFCYLRGADDEGRAITIADPLAATLQERAVRGGSDPRPLLGLHDLFGDLGQSERFVADLTAALARLERDGACRALSDALNPA